MAEDEESSREDEEYIASVLDRKERGKEIMDLAVVIGCAVFIFGALVYFVNRRYLEGVLCIGFVIFLILVWLCRSKEYENLRSARQRVGL